ncbi:hypothetical protein LCGC14_1427610 [marine sediment metagenome]|uniref:Uncharacterized protein n=1 Tax=marine sediment metagenome TaxID=412755 RepID=A0A0F9JPI0_9ZZZZ
MGFTRCKWITFYWQDLHYGSWEVFLSVGKLELRLRWNND